MCEKFVCWFNGEQKLKRWAKDHPQFKLSVKQVVTVGICEGKRFIEQLIHSKKSTFIKTLFRDIFDSI